MRYEKEFIIDLVTYQSFYDFVKYVKANHIGEQIIGYKAETIEKENKMRVVITFFKEEKKNEDSNTLS